MLLDPTISLEWLYENDACISAIDWYRAQGTENIYTLAELALKDDKFDYNWVDWLADIILCYDYDIKFIDISNYLADREFKFNKPRYGRARIKEININVFIALLKRQNRRIDEEINEKTS